MKKALKAFFRKYYGEVSDSRVRIFNTLGSLGFILGIVFGIFSLFVHSEIINVFSNFGASVVAAFVVWRTNKTGNFKRYFLFTVVSVFMMIFPVLFFVGGGIASGMPSFFVFAVVFTVIMLEDRRRTIFTILEILLYVACLLLAYFYPGAVVSFPTEADMKQDVIIACLASSVVVAIAIYQHIVVYDRKQKELEKANERLFQLNRMKTEFLQDIKHEIRNPLHVISLGTGIMDSYMEAQTDAATARTALSAVQNEALRLGRMINGMLELATMNKNPMSREKIDFAAMLRKCAEASRLQMEKKQIALRLEIAPDLPFVYAETEQLERIPVNLLQNAIDSTHGGEISIAAATGKSFITVRVSDTGEGITQDLLPRIFERGVSGKGGKGYGLSICKTIIEAHGGAIEMESEPGKGTTAIFTIPVYGGQSGAGEHE